MTKATKYENWHVIIEKYNNVIFIVKFLIVEKVFKEILGCGLENNDKTKNMDLFWKRIVSLIKDIFLQNYIY